jgi:hypothetical protein
LKISGMFLIVLHPDNKIYERIEVANMEKEILALFQERKNFQYIIPVKI